MAVYTELNKEKLIEFLKLYNIGNLLKYEGITEGIENTNFYIETTRGKYVLTIFENRVNKKDLPFFLSIMSHLSKNDFSCPCPISDLNNNYVQEILGKPTIIVNFLEGKSKIFIKSKDCLKVGSYMGYMHNKSLDFSVERQNSMSFNEWKNLINKCNNSIPKYILNKFDPNLLGEIKRILVFCEKNWPYHLPKGFIHADMFPDNVFFIDDKISGIIDFYFACTDLLAYDLAIAINAWCFNNHNVFDKQKYESLLRGYNTQRKLSRDEIFYLPLLSQAASIRFLLTRLYDWVNTPDNANVIPKNPDEYIIKMRYFKSVLKNFANKL